MADLAPDQKFGEALDEGKQTIVVQVSEAVIKGDLLKITGRNAAQQWICAKHDAGNNALAVALFPAAANQLTEVLVRGTVKLRFGAAVAAGTRGAPDDGKLVAAGAGGAGNPCCIAISTATQDDDTGLVYWLGLEGLLAA